MDSPSVDRASAGRAAVPAPAPATDSDVVSYFHRGACEPHTPWESGRELKKGMCVAVCTYKRAGSLSRFLDSLCVQEEIPRQVVIVDASPDDETERLVRSYRGVEGRVGCLVYLRVRGMLRGLTRQRNYALLWVTTETVAFFDDDIVLLPGSLRELYRVFASQEGIAGVGCHIENEAGQPSLLWRLRRVFGIVDTLQPGLYCRSGIAIPWGFLATSAAYTEGDWLPGGATLWKTESVRSTRFNEAYSGYSHGEDLEFSLRVRSHGKLGTASAARVLHMHDHGGRPSAYEMGYMTARNAYDIQSRLLSGRTWKDGAYFFYAWGMDALIRAFKLSWPRGFGRRLDFLHGRFAFLINLLSPPGRRRLQAESRGRMT